MKNKLKNEQTLTLRQKAEEHLQIKKSKTNKMVTEIDLLKIVHELQVHKIELEMQNDELLFQNEEKEKRAAELIIANKELLFQNEEKEKRAMELIIAKEKAEESDRLKLAFLRTLSHEIRTPINSIIGLSDIIELDFNNEKTLNHIRLLKDNSQKLFEILNDIIEVSLVSVGKIVVIKNIRKFRFFY